MPENLLCFSHLRWDFVFQRPQHLLSRFAKDVNVYFFEEPIFDATENPYLATSNKSSRLQVLTPHLLPGISPEQVNTTLSKLLDSFLGNSSKLDNWMFWYYTPMALSFSEHLKPKMIIFDCMDELSAFDFAPPELVAMEKKLLGLADVVFTGGHSLYEAKKNQHANMFPFPSSIDKHHFSKARTAKREPEDQAGINGLKLGFFGVIDERFDIDLIEKIAKDRPNWNIVLIGPVVKIPEHSLPQHANIHYLGQKSYEQLPLYLSGWDIALIPFKLNQSTRFISPTKTPEYLAAGVPVVSTPIRDVIKPYGVEKLVQIAENASQFIAAIETEIKTSRDKKWLAAIDAFLKDKSWDNTYLEMKKRMLSTLNQSGALLAS